MMQLERLAPSVPARLMLAHDKESAKNGSREEVSK